MTKHDKLAKMQQKIADTEDAKSEVVKPDVGKSEEGKQEEPS